MTIVLFIKLSLSNVKKKKKCFNKIQNDLLVNFNLLKKTNNGIFYLIGKI